MFELIGSIFSFAFGLIRLGFSLAWGLVQFIFGLLGGIFSLILSLGGFILAASLILVAVFRRKEQKAENAGVSSSEKVYDVDNEEFTSFYDQFRTEE